MCKLNKYALLMLLVGIGCLFAVRMVGRPQFLNAQTTSPTDQLNIAQFKLTEEQAIKTAQKILGDDSQYKTKDNISASRELLSAGDDVPFLKLVNHPIWRVKFSNIKLKVTVPQNPDRNGHDTNEPKVKVANTKIHVLNVLIYDETGQLVKIISDQNKDMQIRSVTEQEKELGKRDEEFVSLPSDLPNATFDQALQSIQDESGGDLIAPGIEAYYIMHLEKFKEHPTPHPMWIIRLYSLPRPSWVRQMTLEKNKPVKSPSFMTIENEVDPKAGKFILCRNNE